MLTLTSDFIYVTPAASSKKYYESLGYVIESAGSRGKYKTVLIKIIDLLPNSNVFINYICSGCDVVHSTRYCRFISNSSGYCESCNRKYTNIGNKHGKANKGKSLIKMQGENHPRWNTNKTNQKLYYSKVSSATRINKRLLKGDPNYNNIGLCGVDGAYQLDHIIPIKYGFDNNILPSIIADVSNLQIIPWKENRNKSSKY